MFHCNYDLRVLEMLRNTCLLLFVLVAAESQQVHGNGAACMERSSSNTSKTAFMYAHFLDRSDVMSLC